MLPSLSLLVAVLVVPSLANPFHEEDSISGVHWPLLQHLWSGLKTGHLDPLSIHPLVAYTQLDNIPKELDDSILDSPAVILSHLERKLQSQDGIGKEWSILRSYIYDNNADTENDKPSKQVVCPTVPSTTSTEGWQWRPDGELVPPQTSWSTVPNFLDDVSLSLKDIGLPTRNHKASPLRISSSGSSVQLDVSSANVFAFGPGTSLLAGSLARAVPNATVVMFHDPRAYSSPVKVSEFDFVNGFRSVTGIENLYLCASELTTEFLDGALNHHVRSDLSIILNLHWLAGRHLPVETEYLLGRVMTFSKTLLLPVKLPDTRYFSFWASTKALVKRAAASAELSVNTWELTKKSSPYSSMQEDGLLLVSIATPSAQEQQAAQARQEESVAKATKTAKAAVEYLRKKQEAAAQDGAEGGNPTTIPVSIMSRHCHDQVTVFENAFQEALRRRFQTSGDTPPPARFSLDSIPGPGSSRSVDSVQRPRWHGISAAVLVSLGLVADDRETIMSRLMSGDYHQGPAVIPHTDGDSGETGQVVDARCSVEAVPSVFTVYVQGRELYVLRAKDIVLLSEETPEADTMVRESDGVQGQTQTQTQTQAQSQTSLQQLGSSTPGKNNNEAPPAWRPSEPVHGRPAQGVRDDGPSAPDDGPSAPDDGPSAPDDGPSGDREANPQSNQFGGFGFNQRVQSSPTDTTSPNLMTTQGNSQGSPARSSTNGLWKRESPATARAEAATSQKGRYDNNVGDSENEGGAHPAAESLWDSTKPEDAPASSTTTVAVDKSAGASSTGNPSKAGDNDPFVHKPSDLAKAWSNLLGDKKGGGDQQAPFDPFSPTLPKEAEESAKPPNPTTGMDTGSARSPPLDVANNLRRRGDDSLGFRRRLSGVLSSSLSRLSRGKPSSSSPTSSSSPFYSPMYGGYMSSGSPFGPSQEPNPVDFDAALLRLHGSQSVFSGFQPTGFESIHGSFAAAVAEESLSELEGKGHLPSVWNGERISEESPTELFRDMSDVEVIRIWSALKKEIINAAPIPSKDKANPGQFPDSESPSILVYGGSLSSVGLKAALDLPKSLVLNVFPSRTGVSSHLATLKLLAIPNNLVGVSKLRNDVLSRLEQFPSDKFRFQVLGMEVWPLVAAAIADAVEPLSVDFGQEETAMGWGLPRNIEGLDAASMNLQLSLTELLSLSHSTLVPLPPWHVFLSAVASAYPDQLKDDAVDEDLLALTQEDPLAPFREPSKLEAAAKAAHKKHKVRAGWRRIVPRTGRKLAAMEDRPEESTEDSMPARPTASAGRGLAAPALRGERKREDVMNSAFELAVSRAFQQLRVTVRSSSVASTLAALYDSKATDAYTSLRSSLRCRMVLKNDKGHCGYSRNQKETEPFSRMFQDLCSLPEGPCNSLSVTKLPRPAKRPPRHGTNNGWDIFLRIDASSAASQDADTFDHTDAGVLPTSLSLHTLLSLGLVPELRADMLRLMLSLPYARIYGAAAANGYRIAPSVLQAWTAHATTQGAQAPPPDSAPEGAAPLSLAPHTIRYTIGGALAGRGLRTTLPHSPVLVYVVPDGPLAQSLFFSRGLVDFPPPPPSLFSQSRGTSAFKEAAAVQEAWEGFKADELRRWRALWPELEGIDVATGGKDGTFSYLELLSGPGVLSAEVAKRFPEATVISVESSKTLSAAHLAVVLEENLKNNAVCLRKVDQNLVKALQKSPEFLRYQVVGANMVDILNKLGLSETQEFIGTALSLAATSFLRLPTSMAFSYAFTTLFHAYPDPDIAVAPTLRTSLSPSVMEATFYAEHHPRPLYANAAARFMTDVVKSKRKTRVALNRIGLRLEESSPWAVESNLMRVDLLNVTREVQHHFESEIDGHERTYTLNIEVNVTATKALQAYGPQVYQPRGVRPQDLDPAIPVVPIGNHPSGGRILSVRLQRHMDKFFIPYDSLYGITLIAAMRLGLQAPQRAQLYHEFVAMPLYQDQTPWNIVLKGPSLDYIDFDTKDHSYDELIPKAFEIMEVFFNYKRTIEDFKRCGDKAPVLYGFSLISNCVGSDFRGPCDDHSRPVPCGDGTCHSDYISCLRAISKSQVFAADRKRLRSQQQTSHKEALRSVATARLSLLDSTHSQFGGTKGHNYPVSSFLTKDSFTFAKEGREDDDALQ